MLMDANINLSKKRRNRKQRQEVTCHAYDKRERLISVGRNSYTKSHPIQHHFAKLVGKPEAIYLHAEVDALLRAGKRKVYKLVVSRKDKQGNMVNSKPCPICMAAIRAYGVTQIEHS